MKEKGNLIKKNDKVTVAIIIFITILVLILVYYYFLSRFISFGPSDYVTRSFSQTTAYEEETIEVTLSLVLTEGNNEKVVTIEENLPSGAVIVDNGGGTYTSSQGKLRWIVESAGGIQNMVRKYTVKYLTSGLYTTSGTYMFGSDPSPRSINGVTQVNVGICTPDPSGEICDGSDNDCDRQIDEGTPELLCTRPGNSEPRDAMSCISGACICTSNYPMDKLVFIVDSQSGETGNCNNCVDIGEIGKYKQSWLSGDNSITQLDVTGYTHRWLTGDIAC